MPSWNWLRLILMLTIHFPDIFGYLTLLDLQLTEICFETNLFSLKYFGYLVLALRVLVLVHLRLMTFPLIAITFNSLKDVDASSFCIDEVHKLIGHKPKKNLSSLCPASAWSIQWSTCLTFPLFTEYLIGKTKSTKVWISCHFKLF